MIDIGQRRPGESVPQYMARKKAAQLPLQNGIKTNTPLNQSPYETFVGQNAPINDAGAAGLSNDLLGNLGKATQSIPSYKVPEKINIAKAQSMPVEYYQSQIDDLSKPLTAQYDKSRALMRGDQAARGTIYDSEGASQITNELDAPFLEQLGSITRGVQQQRMQNENQNQQFNITNELNEGLDRRQLGTTSQLQGMGINSNLLNSLLGYGADRYGTEANLFGNIYGSDTDFNKSLLEDKRLRQEMHSNDVLKLLELQGYTDQPQGPLWEAVAEELGYKMNSLQPPSEVNAGTGAQVGQNGAPPYNPTPGEYAWSGGRRWQGTTMGTWKPV